MPIITSIKQQKNKNRVNVYLDGKFGFGIDLDNFVKLGLKVGQELTDSEIEKIKDTSDFQKSFDKVLRFAMARPRSEKEYIDYFRRKNFDDSNHRSFLEKLQRLSLLNDLEFAKWWIDQRLQFKKKSKRIIIQELRQKGISQNDIDDAFTDVIIDEEKLAKELLEKKSYKWKNLEPRERKQKMSQYLASKGFSWDVIEKIVDNNKNPI